LEGGKMEWKEFLEPNFKKVLLTIVLLVLFQLFSVSLLPQNFVGKCLICVTCQCLPEQKLCNYEFLTAPMFFYLLSCIIVWIGPYEKKRPIKK
jgi:hypothetical protein